MNRIQIPLNPDPDVTDPEAAESDNRRQWPRYAFPERESFTLTADGRISYLCYRGHFPWRRPAAPGRASARQPGAPDRASAPGPRHGPAMLEIQASSEA